MAQFKVRFSLKSKVNVNLNLTVIENLDANDSQEATYKALGIANERTKNDRLYNWVLKAVEQIN
jgi:hypothetical protein